MLSKLNITQMNIINSRKKENVIKDVNDGKLPAHPQTFFWSNTKKCWSVFKHFRVKKREVRLTLVGSKALESFCNLRFRCQNFSHLVSRPFLKFLKKPARSFQLKRKYKYFMSFIFVAVFT